MLRGWSCLDCRCALVEREEGPWQCIFLQSTHNAVVERGSTGRTLWGGVPRLPSAFVASLCSPPFPACSFIPQSSFTAFTLSLHCHFPQPGTLHLAWGPCSHLQLFRDELQSHLFHDKLPKICTILLSLDFVLEPLKHLFYFLFFLCPLYNPRLQTCIQAPSQASS